METLRTLFGEVNAAHLKRWLAEDDPRWSHTLDFVLKRFSDGEHLFELLSKRYPDVTRSGTRILDLGSGNGGIIFPFAASGHYSCWCLDTFVHPELVEVAQRGHLEISIIAATGEAIPIRSATFDLVLYLETIEHVDKPRAVGLEISRILRPGGLCVISTPPRSRFLLRKDPHYRIRGLVCLPNVIQKWIVERVSRRGTRYEVDHIYWTVQGVLKTIPGLQLADTIGSTRLPIFRSLDWDLIIAKKPVE